jgi:hypothetical protein
MGDYNLSGLHPREFEHLIQALAQKVIAPGVRVFGDGPDGGREATFEGAMDYPSEAAPWNGYLVIQAKFLQRPSRPSDEGDWALGQLKRELEKYCDPGRGLRAPEYYIFATNAVLTPVQDFGSIDKADQLLKSYSVRLGIKGFEAWHHDILCRFLDGQEGIRRRYSVFISAGDVLAQVVASLAKQRPDFETVITNFLQKQLVADQYVKLGQAGYASEDKPALAQVFVDLETTEDGQVNPANEGIDQQGRSTGGFTSLVLKEASQLLDPRTVWEREQVQPQETTEPNANVGQTTPVRKPQQGRYLLLGGPGQGKTTISQYLCQLYRAAILNGRHPSSLTIETRRAIQVIASQCVREGIDLPTVRRYPVRVVLSQFATDLASETAHSLLDFIFGTVRRVTSHDLSIDDLRAWLSSYPWFVVLDGLDEVPASSNRAEVLEAISDFWTDVAECNADVMVVATTRPQGYDKELTPVLYRQFHLTPLSTSRAMHYAERLVEARYEEDADGRNRVLEGLKAACGAVSTARLMRTPLQVTIMALLVDRHGSPPSQRWPLFRKYFEVIYERELAKGGTIASLLRDHRPHVEAIHHRVGLRLQVDGERAGAAEALLDRVEFVAMVRDRLAEVGHEGRALDVLAGRIVDAAMQRLVFLVAPIDGRVGFEVRSLQEFMAAEAMTANEDAQVRARLDDIAPFGYWRNVFLFAAGHWVAHREYALDTLITICAARNEAPSLGAVVLEGSRLALDLLEDGVAREYPNCQRALARKSLRLLRFPPGDWIDRLASLMTSDIEDVYFEEITDRLSNADVYAQLGAWVLLHRLAYSGSSRARDLYDLRWPSVASLGLAVVRAVSWQRPQFEPADKTLRIIPGVTFFDLREAEVGQPFYPAKQANLPKWSVAIGSLMDRSIRTNRALKIPVRLEEGFDYTLGVTPIGPGPHRDLAALAEMPVEHPAWTPIVAAARFIASPSPRALADTLRALAAQWNQSSYVVAIPTPSFPWPLAECIAAGSESNGFLSLAERVESGELGDVPDWEAAEQRWSRAGLDLESITALTDEHWPYDRWSLMQGFPFRHKNVTITYKMNEMPAMRNLLRLREGLPSSRIRSEIAALILERLGGPPLLGQVHPLPPVRELIDLLHDIGRGDLDLGIFASLSPEEAARSEWVELFDLVGSKFRLVGGSNAGRLPGILASLYTLHPDRPGLVKMLGALVILGYPVPALLPVLPRDHSDSNYSFCSLILRLGQPILSEAEAEQLARTTRDLIDRDPILINPICDVVIRRQKGIHSGIQFLANMLPSWPPARWLSKGRAIAFLEGYLQTGRSPLVEPHRSRN